MRLEVNGTMVSEVKGRFLWASVARFSGYSLALYSSAAYLSEISCSNVMLSGKPQESEESDFGNRARRCCYN